MMHSEQSFLVTERSFNWLMITVRCVYFSWIPLKSFIMLSFKVQTQQRGCPARFCFGQTYSRTQLWTDEADCILINKCSPLSPSIPHVCSHPTHIYLNCICIVWIWSPDFYLPVSANWRKANMNKGMSIIGSKTVTGWITLFERSTVQQGCTTLIF